MKCFGEFLFISLVTVLMGFTLSANAIIVTPDLEGRKVTGDDNNNFIDPRVDYSKFKGRVTDKDDTGRILKVQVENNNTKFLKAGDLIYFKVNNHENTRLCKASVRSVEDFFFSIYVQDFKGCWNEKRYFPRGLQLNFSTDLMATRVFEASEYRKLLIMRKEGFLNQLNGINKFIWTYDQQKLRTAITYDERINAILREKQLAIDNLLQKKQENLTLQTMLIDKLDSVDESLKHYKVERQEPLIDRWNLDHDEDLPFGRRPGRFKRK